MSQATATAARPYPRERLARQVAGGYLALVTVGLASLAVFVHVFAEPDDMVAGVFALLITAPLGLLLPMLTVWLTVFEESGPSFLGEALGRPARLAVAPAHRR